MAFAAAEMPTLADGVDVAGDTDAVATVAAGGVIADAALPPAAARLRSAAASIASRPAIGGSSSDKSSCLSGPCFNVDVLGAVVDVEVTGAVEDELVVDV